MVKSAWHQISILRRSFAKSSEQMCSLIACWRTRRSINDGLHCSRANDIWLIIASADSRIVAKFSAILGRTAVRIAETADMASPGKMVQNHPIFFPKPSQFCYNKNMQEEVIISVSDFVANTSYLTWDTLVVIGFVILVCGYGYTLGKDFIVPFLVSIYIAGFVMLFVPYVAWLASLIETDQGIASIIVFLAIFLIIFFILKTNGFFEPYVVPTGFELGTISIAISGLMLVIVTSFMSAEMVASFSPAIRLLFVGDIQTTIWALLPVGVLLLIRGDT
ncbi:TPA: hypothetical protein DDY56_02145 [Candidatus Uhrbacteria bacterium]|nr:MAG: hypothetical protein A2317_00545 [Candidatus Uhrbacteria bacterium RIFOXYB2_FULL_41_10]OGL94981.1 MAG: hypothetical protein A2258_02040 [Candidatus Uhrbacteria bacterium RIFOXYA2_FULL_41_8]HAL50257.1 hypothetical protein [Candidatus Uhrbacteria bacterium]HAN06454.1 hypothetical protein [Candidatus Uhrbacteria bacterium]HAP66077.1 hypothetical protein [Candidatus Uhrbacteria bacterium]